MKRIKKCLLDLLVHVFAIPPNPKEGAFKWFILWTGFVVVYGIFSVAITAVGLYDADVLDVVFSILYLWIVASPVFILAGALSGVKGDFDG